MTDYLSKAYIAGFIDGEGCFTVQRVPSHGSVVYRAWGSVSNTNRKILEMIQFRYGGHLCCSVKGSHTRKPLWLLSLNSLRLKHFLKDILPFLIVKRNVAWIVYCFLLKMPKQGANLVNGNWYKRKSSLFLSKDEIAAREACYSIVKKILRRGGIR